MRLITNRKLIVSFCVFLNMLLVYAQEEREVVELDSLITQGRNTSVIRQIREDPVSVEVIDLEPVLHKSGDVVSLLNRIPGVIIRSDGAIGDELNFSINGLDKKSIAIFKDGVPMSFYGHSFSPGIVPVNMFKRIEVYKGVLPIAFGADALGGGINFVTRQPTKKYVDISTEVGSFSTYRNSANIFIPNKKNTLYGGANLAFTASDNDWKVEVNDTISNSNSNNGTTSFYNKSEWLPLKNNYTDMFTGEVFVGVKNKSWVDDLRVSYIKSDFYRRINNIPGSGDTRNVVARALFAHAREKSNAGVITYKKSFFNKKLNFNIMAGISGNKVSLIDSTYASINDYGEITSFQYNPKGWPAEQTNGELAPYGIYSNLDFTLKAVRFNATYDVFKNHQLQFNHMYTSTERIGSDPMGGLTLSLQNDSQDYGEYVDVYKTLAQHQKTITAFGLKSYFFKRKLQTLIAYKFYERGADGYSTYGKSIFKQNTIMNSDEKSYMIGVSYKPIKSLLLKASYENTTRMPDDYEVFGFVPWYIASNFGIDNEHSKNFNVQAQFTRPKWMLSASYFYRETVDKIYLQPDIPFSYYTNLPGYYGVLSHGFEVDLTVHPLSFMDIGFNGMLLNKRQKIIDVENLPPEIQVGVDKRYRFVDHPPVLMNADASLYWNNLFKKGDRIDVYYYWNYIQKYIPDQFAISEKDIFDDDDLEDAYGDVFGGDLDTHSAGISYLFANPKVSLSFEVRNIADRLNYVSKSSGPRRSFYFKVRWQPNFKD